MISNFKEMECIICEMKVQGKEPLFNGIVFINLQNEPFICERCLLETIIHVLGRTAPKSKFDKYMNWKQEIGLKKSNYTVVQQELGI